MRKLEALLLLDNAACHNIDYTKFRNIRVEYLRPCTVYIQLGIWKNETGTITGTIVAASRITVF